MSLIYLPLWWSNPCSKTPGSVDHPARRVSVPLSLRHAGVVAIRAQVNPVWQVGHWHWGRWEKESVHCLRLRWGEFSVVPPLLRPRAPFAESESPRTGARLVD